MSDLLYQMELITGESDTKLLDVYLRLAAAKILDKCYPFGYDTETTDVPDRYKSKQLDLAVILFYKRGAEGETTHNENGVNRSLESEQSILKSVTPNVKVVG